MTDEISRAFARPAEPCLTLPAHLRKPRLRRAEAAEYLEAVHGIVTAVSTLAKLASVGGGPSFNKYGVTPLYPRESLDKWAADKLGSLRNSTSDKGK